MNKRALQGGLFIFLLTVGMTAVFSSRGSSSLPSALQPAFYKVCFADVCFRAEAAVTPEQRGRGLMNREPLPDDQAMIFFFESEKNYPIWMKNMLFAIDIVWLDSRKKIVDMRLGVPPCISDPCPVYEPSSASRYVLELMPGTVFKARLKTGDQMSIRPAEPADFR